MGKKLILKPLPRCLNLISFMLIIFTYQLIQTISILWFCHRSRVVKDGENGWSPPTRATAYCTADSTFIIINTIITTVASASASASTSAVLATPTYTYNIVETTAYASVNLIPTASSALLVATTSDFKKKHIIQLGRWCSVAAYGRQSL
jgi:hypothetical protein